MRVAAAETHSGARAAARAALAALPLRPEYVQAMLEGVAEAGPAVQPATARKRGRGRKASAPAPAALPGELRTRLATADSGVNLSGS